MFTEERAILATMNFNSEESREKLRELIHRLAEKMHAKGDPWLLKGSTAHVDSWYNRHLRKMKEEKKEKKESIVKKEKMECVRVEGDDATDVGGSSINRKDMGGKDMSERNIDEKNMSEKNIDEKNM